MLWVKAGFVQKLMGICRIEKYIGVQNSSLVSLGSIMNEIVISFYIVKHTGNAHTKSIVAYQWYTELVLT